MKGGVSSSWFDRLLGRLADLVCSHRKWVFWAHCALFAASVLITVFGLRFDMNRNDLVGGDKHYHQNFLRLLKEFPNQDDLVVVVESENAEKNRQFQNVFWKGDFVMLGSKALLFVPKDDLEMLLKALKDFRPFLDQFRRSTNLISLFELVNTQIRTASREESSSNDALVGALPALERIIRQATEALQRPGAPPSPGMEALFSAGEQAQKSSYISFANGSVYLIISNPASPSVKAQAVKRVRALLEETRREG